ncbi:retrovirus-related pol polyprotein from transposon TNT 1-94 [Tanacetum coccineum]
MQLMFIQMNCALQTKDVILWMLTRKLISSMCNVRQEANFDEYHTNSIHKIQHYSSLSVHGFIWHRLAYFMRKKDKSIGAGLSGGMGSKNSLLHWMTSDKSFIFHKQLPTIHNSFVPPPSFSDMVPFYKQVLGFTMELKTQSSFKTTGLLQPWQTYYGKDSTIRFIIQHLRFHIQDLQRSLKTQKQSWNADTSLVLITDEMKLTEHYWMYAEVFRIDVPLTQSQPTESTQGTHRTPSAPRSPNPDKEVAESSAPRRSTMIRLRLPERRSIRLTPPAPVLTVDKADEMILQDTLQVSLAEHKSREEQEARENVALVDEHLASEEIEEMVDGQENIIDDSSIPRNDESNIPGTRIESRINVNDEDEEITDEVYELKRREKGKIVEETRNSPIPTPIRSPRIHTNLVSSDTEKLQELTDTPHTTSSSSSPHKKLAKTNRLLSLFKTKPTRFKRYKSFFYELQGRYGYLFAHLRTLPAMVDKHIKEQVVKLVPEQVRNQVPVYVAEGLILERQKAKEEMESYMSGHILHVHPAQSQTSLVLEQQYQLYLAMKVDPQLQQQDIAIWLALQMKFERNTVLQTACRTPAVCPRDQNDNHDDAHPEGENSAKGQKTSKYEAYVSGESSSGQVFQEEQAPSTSGNQEQNDDFDFWTHSYALDDDEIPSKQVSQEIMEEVSLTINEAKLRKMADEMLRQRCTSGDEHQYHIDQMKNFLKNPEAPALSLINQDLLYLKKGNSGPEKIVVSLHKFPAIIFNDDDIEEQTSRWVNNCVKKFNPYARYGVEHWKNPHAKIFYIRKKKKPGKPKEEIYSNSKIVKVIKTYWELGHEHKFIIVIVAMVELMIAFYQQKVNLTAPTMTFPGIEDHEMFSIIYEPVHGIIYKTSKKEKRVMRHSEIHKFCDATLNRVLEGLKSYNNDVKYGYVQKDLTKDETEYLKLFEEEIEERLKHQRQMRRWEMFGINKWYQSFALRNFDLEDMELKSTISGPTVKLPILKLVQDNGTSVTKMSIPATAEEKTNKNTDVKARSLLLMGLPNEHQLTFSQYPDAKSMFDAIETRFGGNAATKKTQKTLLNIASVSDNTVYAFMVENSNGSNVLHHDLEKIHEDDLEAIDLKWQLSLLSVGVKKYYQRTCKNIFINANDIAGYDKSKVECYNCHKLGHFARECRAPRSKESQFRNQDNTKKQWNNEDTSSKAMLAIDGVGFD